MLESSKAAAVGREMIKSKILRKSLQIRIQKRCLFKQKILLAKVEISPYG